VTAGHGELPLEPRPDGRDAADLVARLRRDGAAVEPTAALDGGVPARCRVLAVLGPARSLSAAEALAVDGFLARGGRLLLALEAAVDPDAGGDPAAPRALLAHGLEPVLARLGLRTPAAIAVDPARDVGIAHAWATYDGYGAHPITVAFPDRRLTVWQTPRVVELLPDAAERPVRATALVSSTATGWGETDVAALLGRGEVSAGDDDLAGPVAVAAAVEEPASTARVVVLGSARSLASELAARGVGANGALAAEAVAWLAGRTRALELDAKTPERVRLVMTEAQLRRVFALCVIGLPALAALLAAALWRWRRRG
jgi:ABC-type uncharacterized transport system involved in gliding motility auxiliary subunit